MKIFSEHTATREGLNQKKEPSSAEKIAAFSGDDLNSYFKLPTHWEGSSMEDEITHPFLTPSDYDGLGGGFGIKEAFYKSKYNSQAGLLWILDYLQNIQNKQQDDEANFSESTNMHHAKDAEGNEDNDFWMFDDEEGDMLPSNDLRDLHDYDLALQRDFVLESLLNVETDEKTIDKIIDFLQKDCKSHVYTLQIAEVLNHTNSDYAARKLLKLIRDETGADKHSQYKNDLAKIIYRLEFGKLNISEKGVRYLEKMYDLGELNDPEYFVNRLTSDGMIGIFDQNKDLQYYFEIGDIAGEEEIMKPRVLEFTCETLFSKKENETEEEQLEREEALQEFKEGYFNFYDDAFIKRTGTRFNNLRIKEQGQFLIYHKHSDENKREQLLDFVAQYHKNGLRAFLSLEHGGQEMGEKILAISDKFNKNIVNSIFAKYAELAEAAQASSEQLAKEFNINDQNIIQNVSEQLLLRGKQLLVLCSDNTDISSEKLLKKLASIQGEMELLTSTLRSFKESGETMDLEMIKDLRIEKRMMSRPAVLSPKEKDEVEKIFAENYKTIFADNPGAYQRVWQDFQKEIENLENQIVYIMKYKNKVIAFCRFNQISDREVYGGSLNVAKEIQGLRIGNHFIQKTLQEISQRYDIKIKTRKDNPANDGYRRQGFLDVGEHEENDGTEYYDMILPRKNNLPELRKAA